MSGDLSLVTCEERQFHINIRNEVRVVLTSFFCEFVHALELSCAPFCAQALRGGLAWLVQEFTRNRFALLQRPKAD